MTDINNVFIIGRVVRDCELSYFNSGQAFLKGSIAVNRDRVQNEQKVSEVNFFDFSIFGKLAEKLAQYLKKGKQIAIHGGLRQNRWQGEDGKKYSRVEIIVNDIQLLGNRNDAQDNGAQYGNNQQYAQNNGGYNNGGYNANMPAF